MREEEMCRRSDLICLTLFYFIQVEYKYFSGMGLFKKI